MTEKPPFPNDDSFIMQIEAKIDPNHQFPFVQLESLVEEKVRSIKFNISIICKAI